MFKFNNWTVVTVHDHLVVEEEIIVIVLAIFQSLLDAAEYVAFVNDYDLVRFPNWTTFVVEGDF